MPDPTHEIPPAVQPFLEAAREYIQRAIGVELDGSETSLAYVDHYLEEAARTRVKDDVLALVAPALGAYFGEVAIERFGGRWRIDSGSEPAGWQVELAPPELELRFFPVGMAAEGLRRKEVRGYDASFSARPALMGPLAEALSHSPPVDERYYYSLTGRLETLGQALGILIELERQRREDET